MPRRASPATPSSRARAWIGDLALRDFADAPAGRGGRRRWPEAAATATATAAAAMARPYRGIGTSMPTVARSVAMEPACASVELAGDQL